MGRLAARQAQFWRSAAARGMQMRPALTLAPWLRMLELRARWWLRLETRLRTEDRRVLETIILPHFAGRDDIERVLFVGCAVYTRHYPALLPGKEFFTIDCDPRQRRFGSSHHIVDRLENLERHVKPGFFDLVLCNGVFGWGLQQPMQCETAFSACYRCLRAGGEMVLGWNDIRQRRPFPLEQIGALALFEPKIFAPLGSCRCITATANRHTYAFFVTRPQT